MSAIGKLWKSLAAEAAPFGAPELAHKKEKVE
jgi:hypothetical protein